MRNRICGSENYTSEKKKSAKIELQKKKKRKCFQTNENHFTLSIQYRHITTKELQST